MNVPSEPVSGFSWAIENQLAGMARPGAARDLSQDLAYLCDQKIDLLVSLTEQSLPPDTVRAYGLRPMSIAVADFTAPTLAQLDQFVAAVDDTLAAGRRVGVHCAGGLGRTGTFLAAYFIHQGMPPGVAIGHVRGLRPGSIETPEQESVLFDFANRERAAD
jgi:atypical dual specificity phosphatase